VATLLPKTLSNLISWKFTTVLGREVSRYGEYGGHFWKQYLPAGLEVVNLHPPRAISEDVYRFAERYASK